MPFARKSKSSCHVCVFIYLYVCLLNLFTCIVYILIVLFIYIFCIILKFFVSIILRLLFITIYADANKHAAFSYIHVLFLCFCFLPPPVYFKVQRCYDFINHSCKANTNSLTNKISMNFPVIPYSRKMRF